MRGHWAILCPHVLGQVYGDRWRLVALLAAALEDKAHGIGVGDVAGKRLENGGLEFAGAVAGQELHQSRGATAEIVAALGGTNEQSLDCRGGRYEAVSGAVTAGGVLLCDQSRDVRGILNLGTLARKITCCASSTKGTR